MPDLCVRRDNTTCQWSIVPSTDAPGAFCVRCDGQVPIVLPLENAPYRICLAHIMLMICQGDTLVLDGTTFSGEDALNEIVFQLQLK